MIGLIIIGILLIIGGLYCVVKGKIPFIQKYNGVKKIELHSRIEGGAALLVGILFILQQFMPLGISALILTIFVICILAFVLEIVFKVI